MGGCKQSVRTETNGYERTAFCADQVEEAVREAQKTNRHTREEMETACWELLAEVEGGLDGEEKTYLSHKLDAVRHRMPFKTPGIPWSRVQKVSSGHSPCLNVTSLCDGGSVPSIRKDLDSSTAVSGEHCAH